MRCAHISLLAAGLLAGPSVLGVGAQERGDPELRGRVVSAVTGEPIAGAWIALEGWGRAAKVLLVAPLVAGFAYLSTDLWIVWGAAVVMNLALLAAAIGLMWHGSLAREIHQINLGVLVMVWLLITRFLDLFGSMLESGIVFIVAGVCLGGLSWALERTRRRLIAGPREAAT